MTQKCDHEWGEVQFVPLMKPNWAFKGYSQNGTDIEPILELEGEKVKEKRWTRVCKKCNHSQTTSKERAVVTEPDFSRCR